jgi:hypothetical protein
MLVGTHDSAAHAFNFDISFWTKSSPWEWLRIAAKYLLCVRNRVTSMSQTQQYDVFDQLSIGARVLDLRVSKALTDGNFYCSHTFCCWLLEDVLEYIDTFLVKSATDPTDPIIIMIRLDITNIALIKTIDDEYKLLEIVISYLEKYIATGRLYVYYEPKFTNVLSRMDFMNIRNMSDDINNVWFNVQDVANFSTKFNNTEFDVLGKKTCLDCVLTPTTKSNVITTSLRHYADILHPVIMRVFKSAIQINKHLPLMCTVDFIDSKFMEEFNTFCHEPPIPPIPECTI